MYGELPNVTIAYTSGEEDNYRMNKEEIEELTKWLRDTGDERLFEYETDLYRFFINKKSIANVTIRR
ncbi:hypothetical protein KQI86_06800 [Clostridium sp. MSJ-11]|uniref:Uncharacterized protein n=1 Tax=Clostridium mobile TaxID=2841512 RepID=A0ABS6EFR2_9CLOT|nr:hypothetical protein [Clostridium mobile]MBU5484034.1 hypothetical protein [Clostridium mobile]